MSNGSEHIQITVKLPSVFIDLRHSGYLINVRGNFKLSSIDLSVDALVNALQVPDTLQK